jgi:hypothetical protein
MKRPNIPNKAEQILANLSPRRCDCGGVMHPVSVRAHGLIVITGANYIASYQCSLCATKCRIASMWMRISGLACGCAGIYFLLSKWPSDYSVQTIVLLSPVLIIFVIYDFMKGIKYPVIKTPLHKAGFVVEDEGTTIDKR